MKFSVGDGEGPSNRRRKREPELPRVYVRAPPARRPSWNHDFDVAAVERYVVDDEDDLLDEEVDYVAEEEENDEDDLEEEEEEEDDFIAVGGERERQEEERRGEHATPTAPSSGGGSAVGPTRVGSLSVTLTDPDVLDCSICYDSLTIPVYQCENGHIACSTCCKRLLQKCPSCSLPIGYNRCRAIEKVLESVKVPCPNAKFGCGEIVIYSKKQDHAQACTYAACLCPVSGCNFSGSVKQIYQHARIKHTGPFIRFNFESEFPVFFTMSDKVLILQEEKDGVLFILRNETEGSIGSIVKVSRLGPSASMEGNYFDLGVRTEGCNLRLQSFTKNVQSRNDSPSGSFLLIPANFFGSYGQIHVNLSIWGDGKSPHDILRSSSLLA